MRHNKLHGLRYLAALGVVGTALALAPSAAARVHVNFNLNLGLPPDVHVNVGNYEPYYVGRVYYQPDRAWRPVYSFPVHTSRGIVYRPYVYDGSHVVYRDYIPGPGMGYTRFIREGRGHYNARWRRHDDHDRYYHDHRHHYHDQNGG